MTICGESMDEWIGLPPETRPRCAGSTFLVRHRERYMQLRGRKGARHWWCRKCGWWYSLEENRHLPHNAWWYDRRERLFKLLKQEKSNEG